MTQVKICGLTQEREAEYLNEAGADYAGFVFYPPSKRNVSAAQAEKIAYKLNHDIKELQFWCRRRAERRECAAGYTAVFTGCGGRELRRRVGHRTGEK